MLNIFLKYFKKTFKRNFKHILKNYVTQLCMLESAIIALCNYKITTKLTLNLSRQGENGCIQPWTDPARGKYRHLPLLL